MKKSQVLLLLAFVSLGLTTMSGCAGWQTGGNDSSSHSGGGHHH